MTSVGKKVCVTGASGFIASHLVKRLLEKGYVVHATVRDPNNASKVQHLTSLPRAAENLKLFKANLLEEGSFDAALTDTETLFHTASPFFTPAPDFDPERDFIEPAVKGTLNALNSASRATSVKTVVVTSSVAAITISGGKLPAAHVYSEDDWSDEETLRKNKRMAYALSKTLAEREVWKWAEKHPNIRTVTINPAYVIGKLLQPELNESCEMVLNYLNGSKKSIPNGAAGIVDVEDVAELHVKASEDESTQGRHLSSVISATWDQICLELRKLRPQYLTPTQLEEGEPGKPTLFTNAKARALLQKDFKTFEKALEHTVVSLEEKGFLNDIQQK